MITGRLLEFARLADEEKAVSLHCAEDVALALCVVLLVVLLCELITCTIVACDVTPIASATTSNVATTAAAQKKPNDILK